jgi:hypothetical protein
LESRDSIKANEPGMSPSIDNRAPVSDMSMTLHGRTANPPSTRIHARVLIDLRVDLRCSFDFRFEMMSPLRFLANIETPSRMTLNRQINLPILLPIR